MDERPILERIIDSRDRSVGGGSAAALAGAMAAGLVGMVARLSEGGSYGLDPDRCRGVAEEADALGATLHAGANADADAYRRVVEAYRLPKDGPDEAADRAVQIQKAVTEAATVPRDNARLAGRVQELCRGLAGRSNPNAASDLAVGRLLADAAVEGCLRNVEINLPLIEDAAVVEDLRREIQAVLRGGSLRDATGEEDA